MNLIVANNCVYKFFIEYMQTFEGFECIQFSEIGNYDLTKCDNLFAVQNGNWITENIIRQVKQITLINTEQLTYPESELRFVNEVKSLSKKTGYAVSAIDYSYINQKILEKHSINCDVKEYLSQESETRQLKHMLNNSSKKYDIAFVGWINARRKFVLDRLKENGLEIIIIDAFGTERNRLICQARCLINIHCEEYFNVFESMRCNRWLSADLLVISENSLDSPVSESLKQFSYADLCEITPEVFSKLLI